MILLGRCKEVENGPSPQFKLFGERADLADTACNIPSLVTRWEDLSRRRRGLCVWLPRANAFAMETEPWVPTRFSGDTRASLPRGD